jgi:type VI secretion system secreted protein VgrG
MEFLSQIGSALSLFGTSMSQHARLITMAGVQGSAQESALPESLMVQQFSGREAVNKLFRFERSAS